MLAKFTLAILLWMIWLFSSCDAKALTVSEIGGDYTAEYFNGSAVPQTERLKIVLQSTGIWSVMCKQTVGANTYEYPCYSHEPHG